MERETAVDLTVQRLDIGTDGLEQARAQLAGDTAAGIDNDAQAALDLDVAGDAVDVGLTDIECLEITAPLGHRHAALDDACVELGDGAAGERFAIDHDLEAVVIGRVVAAGDGNGTAQAQFVGGEVGHRRGHHADVGDVDARHPEAIDQCAGHFRRGEPAVAPHGDAAQAFLAHPGPHRPADQAGDVGIERLADHATDVVGPEDAALDDDLRGRRGGGDRLRHGAFDGSAGDGADLFGQGWLGRQGRSGPPLGEPARPFGGFLARHQHQRQTAQDHQQAGQQLDQTVQAQGAGFGERRRTDHPQARGRQRHGAQFGPSGQLRIADLHQGVLALPQREVAALRWVGTQRRREILERVARVGQGDHPVLVTDRGRQRQPGPAGVLHRRHLHRIVLECGGEQAELAVAELFRGRPSGRKVGRVDLDGGDALPGVGHGDPCGGDVARLHRRRHFRRPAPVVEALHLGGDPGRHRRARRAASLGHRLAQRLLRAQGPAAPGQGRAGDDGEHRDQDVGDADFRLGAWRPGHASMPWSFNGARCGRSRPRRARWRRKLRPRASRHGRWEG